MFQDFEFLCCFVLFLSCVGEGAEPLLSVEKGILEQLVYFVLYLLHAVVFVGPFLCAWRGFLGFHAFGFLRRLVFFLSYVGAGAEPFFFAGKGTLELLVYVVASLLHVEVFVELFLCAERSVLGFLSWRFLCRFVFFLSCVEEGGEPLLSVGRGTLELSVYVVVSLLHAEVLAELLFFVGEVSLGFWC